MPDAITTQSMHIIYGGVASGSATWDFVSAGSPARNLCIKDFPDLDNGEPDQVEITTLCDSVHKYIDGLGNLPEELEFTCNFDEDLYDKILTLGAEGHWGLQLGTGSGAPQWVFTGKARVYMVGGGVGDVLEMKVAIKPTSQITKQAVS